MDDYSRMQICPDCGWEGEPREMVRHMEEHVREQRLQRRSPLTIR